MKWYTETEAESKNNLNKVLNPRNILISWNKTLTRTIKSAEKIKLRYLIVDKCVVVWKQLFLLNVLKSECSAWTPSFVKYLHIFLKESQ